MKWYKFKKYLDLKYDFAETSLRISQAISKSQHRKNLEFLKSIEQEEFQWPPIFIIGPPRSGSTLLYQLMTHRYKFAYLQNRMQAHNFTIARYANRHVDVNESYNSDFKSEHGITSNPNGPHEGGFFWRRFFPRSIHDYIAEHKLSEVEDFEIRNTIKFLERHFGVPFLSKNMEAGVRLHSLQKIFPEAIYIVVVRDPRATASSLLKVRLDTYGTMDTWWSIRPKEYENLLKLPNHEQVAYQVANIYQTIFDDMPDKNRQINVQYEDLCQMPLETMDLLVKKLKQHKVALVDNVVEAPKQFPIRKTFLFSDKELVRVEEIFKETGLVDRVPFALNQDNVKC